MTDRKIMQGLTAEMFQHPADRIMITKLAENKTLKSFMNRLLTEGIEEDFYLMNLADNTKLGPNQCKSVYKALVAASKVLDIETPSLFLDTNPTPNAWALGEKAAIIVVTTGLIDLFDNDEIFTVLAHELGHIKCHHTLYGLIARTHLLLGMIPVIGGLLSFGIRLRLFAWYRRGELSADRAALLATQSPGLVSRTMMKLAGGGSLKVGKELNKEEFIRQAEEYKQIQEKISKGSKFAKFSYFIGTFMQTMFMAHPWPAIRAREAEAFAESDRYKNIIKGNYPTEQEEFDFKRLEADGILISDELWKAMGEISEKMKEYIEGSFKAVSETGTKVGKQLKSFLKNIKEKENQ